MVWSDHIPADIAANYEVHDFHHAAAILAIEFPTEFSDICAALRGFRVPRSEIVKPGGNESDIPKRFAKILRPLGWVEVPMSSRMLVDEETIRSDTHLVDFLKNKVAFDLEWNSKDQTFDRDLFAFRQFFEYRRIDVGVLLTRSNTLDPYFKSLGSTVGKDGVTRSFASKYGASTTHMGKLLPRLAAGRHGGCPLLVLGITPALVDDSL